jgi:hypothetical protein
MEAAMNEILTSAAYIQNRAILQAESSKRSALQSICEADSAAREVWELLDTPQTVESLGRILEGTHEPGDELREEITASLTKLVKEDLIQLSPDS